MWNAESGEEDEIEAELVREDPDDDGDEENEEEEEEEQSQKLREGSDSGAESDDVLWRQSFKTPADVAAEQKRLEEEMAQIEQQYKTLRAKLYEQQLQRCKEALRELEQGTYEEYVVGVQQIEDEFEKRKKIASIKRGFQIISLRNLCEGERRCIENDYTHKRQRVYSTLMGELRARQRQLLHEKSLIQSNAARVTARPVAAAAAVTGVIASNVQSGNATPTEERLRPARASARVIAAPRKRLDGPTPPRAPAVADRNKRRKPTATMIVYMLRDEEIIDDIRAFESSALGRRPREQALAHAHARRY